MSGWYELSRLDIQVRPLSGERPIPGNRYSPFDSPWGRTIEVLARELKALDAKRIILGLDFRERDIRLDGFPRERAVMATPTVQLSFESKWGPLAYATCEFTNWQDNTRAVALSMEALRKVDRYGVSKRGEQYAGWRQITSGAAAEKVFTREEAIVVIHGVVGDIFDHDDIDGPHQKDAVREALRRSHPDHGGAVEQFRRVVAAREMIEA